MKVAVIGASGGMGAFFVRYFLSTGETVRASDKHANPGRPTGARGLLFFPTNSEAVEGADVTILAVPMKDTVRVAKEVAKDLVDGSTLVEISSVKGKTLPALKSLLGGRVNLLSVHPLFGPALESTVGMKIAVVSGQKEKGKDVRAAKRLFPKARIIPMKRREHDRMMAVVLSLTHLLNVVYAGTVAGFLSPSEFMKVSTPNSSMQLTLAEAVLAQDPRLSFAIQAGNPFSNEVARAASKELERVMKMVEDSDWKGFNAHLSKLSRSYRTEKRAGAVIREIYSAAEKPT